jgi:G:T-mismatch repair DNA endonuclease (very short patch repair protein)
LRAGGWRVLAVWECAVRGPARRNLSEVAATARAFVQGEAQSGELEGDWANRP